jgi:hypothetical protein
MTSMSGNLYVIQGDRLWVVDPVTGGYAPIDRPHWSYSGPTVMATLRPTYVRPADTTVPLFSKGLKPAPGLFIP